MEWFKLRTAEPTARLKAIPIPIVEICTARSRHLILVMAAAFLKANVSSIIGQKANVAK